MTNHFNTDTFEPEPSRDSPLEIHQIRFLPLQKQAPTRRLPHPPRLCLSPRFVPGEEAGMSFPYPEIGQGEPLYVTFMAGAETIFARVTERENGKDDGSGSRNRNGNGQFPGGWPWSNNNSGHCNKNVGDDHGDNHSEHPDPGNNCERENVRENHHDNSREHGQRNRKDENIQNDNERNVNHNDDGDGEREGENGHNRNEDNDLNHKDKNDHDRNHDNGHNLNHENDHERNHQNDHNRKNEDRKRCTAATTCALRISHLPVSTPATTTTFGSSLQVGMLQCNI